jgi:putative ABC transport system permease protein
VYLYRSHLRAHAVQELLAGLGIAIAVAFIFAVAVANSSIAGSAGEVVRTVVGPANLQLRSRDSDGFDERLLGRVERLPGVKRAAPLLEQTATVVGRDGGQAQLDLVGADIGLTTLDGLARTLPLATLTQNAIGLSEASADRLHVSATSIDGPIPQRVRVKLRGSTLDLKVSAALGSAAVGPLSHAMLAVMPLDRLQQLAGLRGRISRILVQSERGRQSAVRAELARVADGRLTVAPADQDVALLRGALGPSDLATALFVAIAGLLGVLFALLLTVSERRQAIADLRVAGATRSAIIEMVLFQGMCLGLVASLVGLVGGYALLLSVLHQSAGYLTPAFVLGGGSVIGTAPLVWGLVGGVLATCLVASVPLLDMRHDRALDAVYLELGVPGSALPARAQRQLASAGACLLVLSTAVFVLAPSATLIAGAALALATALSVPLVLAGVLRAGRAVANRRLRLTILPVALTSLQATTLRSLALAATGAVALFGSVALGGARDDLLRGIAGFVRPYAAHADLWVTSPHDTQATVDFAAEPLEARIERTHGVTGVQRLQGSFLDLGDRRVWIIARPTGTTLEILGGQIVSGSDREAIARLGERGWITISQQLAREHHVSVGGTLEVPTPDGPVPFKVAAVTTNLGWPPGTILMNAGDYSRYWRTTAPTAFAITLEPGANVRDEQAALERALGPSAGVEVLTARQRVAAAMASAREGLGQLGKITTLLLGAAILALAAALGSSIWQRRGWLSALRLEGTPPSRLRRILATESALMLGAACVTGVVAGIYGQVVIDGYLKHTAGFPVADFAASLRPLAILAVVIAIVLAIVSVPAWIASRVSPALSLQDE